MSYRSLAESLRGTADQVITFLRVQRGLRAKVEEAIQEGLPKPTLHAYTSEGDIVCVEFSDRDVYPESLARMVEDFRDAGLPLRIYSAIPSANQNSVPVSELMRAKRQGVGVMLVSPAGDVTILEEPTPLLLAQLRRIQPQEFPPRLRQSMANAQSTFLSGNPPKGCSDVYDILEDETRRIAKAAAVRGLWNSTPPAIRWELDAWHTVCNAALLGMRFNAVGSLSARLWADVVGVTRHRNETGHKPTTLAARKKRDSEMRTRFEHAADLLKELLQTVKPFRY